MTAKTSTQSRILTNDIYLAAYLVCQGHSPAGVLQNERRRISFLFVGSKVDELRQVYRNGVVLLNMRSFRDSLFRVRKLMNRKQRSQPCPKPPTVQPAALPSPL
jgi:hypothetical protein